MTFSRALMLGILALGSVPACGGDNQAPAASITIVSGEIYADELLLFKDTGALLSLSAKDASGGAVEVTGSVTWTSSAPDTVGIRALGSTTVATGLQDWFDLPTDTLEADADPEAVITATYGDLSASVAARVILEVDGNWVVTVGSDAPLLVPFLQEGRTVSQPLAGMEGTLQGATLTVTTPELSLEGTFTSRTAIQGTGTDADGNVYQWSAVK